jgi:GNAT superfamily N-acetyltransferase
MTENLAINLNRTYRSSIRRATITDLKALCAWLVDEKDRGVHGNFFCNWSVIEKAHHEGKLLVYIDGKTMLPQAFQLGGLVRPGILQVREKYRGTGIGRKMVERCVALARKQDECLLYIECKPSTSIPFWQHMGFTLIESVNGKNYAYRTIDKQLRLPEHGVDVKVVIRFFPESRKWQSQTKPYTAYSPQARHALGIIYFAQRILFHEKAFPDVKDVVVEIEVNGIVRFLDKAKYEEAQQIGVTRCRNGFYIDKIKG